GDLRGIEVQGGQRAEVLGDRFGSLLRQPDDVVALGVEAGAVQLLGQLKGGLHLFVLVHLLQQLLMKAFDAEKRPFHAARPPVLKIAQEQVDTGLHQPTNAVACEQFDDRVGVGGQVSKVFVEDQDETDAQLNVELQNAIKRIEGDGLRLRRENRSLAKGAAKAATAGGKQNAHGKGPAPGQPKACDERRMLNVMEGNAESSRHGLLAVAAKDPVEVGLHRRSQG